MKIDQNLLFKMTHCNDTLCTFGNCPECRVNEPYIVHKAELRMDYEITRLLSDLSRVAELKTPKWLLDMIRNFVKSYMPYAGACRYLLGKGSDFDLDLDLDLEEEYEKHRCNGCEEDTQYACTGCSESCSACDRVCAACYESCEQCQGVCKCGSGCPSCTTVTETDCGTCHNGYEETVAANRTDQIMSCYLSRLTLKVKPDADMSKILDTAYDCIHCKEAVLSALLRAKIT